MGQWGNGTIGQWGNGAMGQWGNGNTISKLATLQKHAIRIINNKGYRNHTDPIFKSQNILKIVDIYKLHVSLCMYDFHRNLLHQSFTNYIPKKNLDESSRITRQHNHLAKERGLEHSFRLSCLNII